MLENFLVVAEVVVNSTEYPAPICPEESNRDSSTDLEPSSSITEIMDKNEELLVESELVLELLSAYISKHRYYLKHISLIMAAIRMQLVNEQNLT